MIRFLMLLAVLLLIAGFAWPWLLPWWHKFNLGHLPGDTQVTVDNFTFYFPITTCAIIGLVLAALAWLIGR